MKPYTKYCMHRCFLILFIFAALQLSASHTYASDWPMFRKDTSHTGNSEELAINPPLSVKWAYHTESNIWSSPTVVDGIVYVGSSDHKVYAVQGKNGKDLWTYETGDSIYSSPAVDNGIVYIGSFDHKVYALDARSGELKWSYKTGGSIYSSPVVIEGVVYIGSFDHKVYALDAETGEHKWDSETGDSIYSSAAVADGRVYIGSSDHKVYALDIYSGELEWTFETGDYVSSSPLVSEGIVYVGSWDKKMYALDAETGKLRWKYATGKGIFSSPAVVGETLLFGSYDGRVYALHKDSGKLKWYFTSKIGIFHSSPIVANGIAYIGLNYGNMIYGLDVKSGKLKWWHQTGASVGASGAISDGVLYIAANDGKIYAFGDITPPASKVTPLKVAQRSTSFKISWKGSDSGGSGIESYDVQFKDGASGTWTDWLVRTEERHTVFGPDYPATVRDGHTYYFQCRARDRAGNVEAFEGGDGDTYATIDSTPPIIAEVKIGGKVVAGGEVITPDPYIEVAISDNVAVNSASITLSIDNKRYKPDSYSSGIARYEHKRKLGPGSHVLKIQVSDVAGNTTPVVEIAGLLVVEGIKATNIVVSPNPFNPIAGPTHIAYTLNTDAAVVLFIYDSRGSLMWKQEFREGEEGGRKGRNVIDWDGVASASSIVVNGEYPFKLTAVKNLIGTGTIVVKK